MTNRSSRKQEQEEVPIEIIAAANNAGQGARLLPSC